MTAINPTHEPVTCVKCNARITFTEDATCATCRKQRPMKARKPETVER
jgi:hypothetical protein